MLKRLKSNSKTPPKSCFTAAPAIAQLYILEVADCIRHQVVEQNLVHVLNSRMIKISLAPVRVVEINIHNLFFPIDSYIHLSIERKININTISWREQIFLLIPNNLRVGYRKLTFH